jgi:hypothetical protein
VNIRNLSKVTVMLTTFLLALPFAPAPVLATATPGVSVALSSSSVEPGGSFSASVMVSNVQSLAGFDLKLEYNPDVLTATSAADASPLSGGLFDKTLFATGCSLGPGLCTVKNPIHSIFQAIGEIHYAAVYQGGITVNPGASAVWVTGGTFPNPSAPTMLLSVNFVANNPPGPSTVYPSIVSIGPSPVLGVEVSGSPTAVTPSTTPASYSPLADVALRSVGCRAVLPGFNVHSKGFSDDVFCRDINTGSISVMVRADFTWTSLNGVTGSASSPIITLAPGQSDQPTATIANIPNAVDIFTVTGTVSRVIQLSDGTFAPIAGGSLTFFIQVNTA